MTLYKPKVCLADPWSFTRAEEKAGPTAEPTQLPHFPDLGECATMALALPYLSRK